MKLILKNRFSSHTSLKIVDKYIHKSFCFGFTFNINDNNSLLVCMFYREKLNNKTGTQEIKKKLNNSVVFLKLYLYFRHVFN